MNSTWEREKSDNGYIEREGLCKDIRKDLLKRKSLPSFAEIGSNIRFSPFRRQESENIVEHLSTFIRLLDVR